MNKPCNGRIVKTQFEDVNLVLFLFFHFLQAKYAPVRECVHGHIDQDKEVPSAVNFTVWDVNEKRVREFSFLDWYFEDQILLFL